MTEIERYAAAAREAGCPEDQVRRFMAAKLPVTNQKRICRL